MTNQRKNLRKQAEKHAVTNVNAFLINLLDRALRAVGLTETIWEDGAEITRWLKLIAVLVVTRSLNKTLLQPSHQNKCWRCMFLQTVDFETDVPLCSKCMFFFLLIFYFHVVSLVLSQEMSWCLVKNARPLFPSPAWRETRLICMYRYSVTSADEVGQVSRLVETTLYLTCSFDQREKC